MIRLTLLTFVTLLALMSYSQERIENRTVLYKYDNGQIMQERIKYEDQDTIVEYIYFQNGKLNYKSQIRYNQKSGWSYTYNKEGELLFRESYLNDKRTGVSEAYYSTGQVSRIGHFENNKNIDTTTFYSRNGEVIKKVAYLDPCDFGSPVCNKIVIEYEEGYKVYSYEVKKGLKSDDHTVYDRTVYQRLMAEYNQIPLHEKGKTIFHSYCGMCHKLDSPIIGPALNCITKTKSRDELTKIIAGENEHSKSILTKKEINALMEFFNKNCP